MDFSQYFFKTKSFDDLKNTAYVVIDTNVLLSAYQWKDVTLREVLDVMYSLSQENRLKIPSHVFKEFIDQRPKRIADILRKIDKELLSKLQKPPKLISVVPFLDMVQESPDYYEFEKQYMEQYELYKKKILNLSEQIKDFFASDPVLDTMQELLTSCYYELDEETTENLENEAKERAKNRIPPLTGGDSAKKENGFGDFIIWKHILSLPNDVIFVTADTKDDWVIKDHHDNVLSVRRELVEEFYKKNQKSFVILSPKEFVELYRPQVGKNVAEDLEKKGFERTAIRNVSDVVRDIILKHDPVGLYSLTHAYDEYDSEVHSIVSTLSKVGSQEELAVEIHRIFVESVGENEAGEITKYLEVAKEIYRTKRILDLFI